MTFPLAAEAVGDLAQAEASGEARTALGSARSRSLTERTGVKPARPRVRQPRAQTPVTARAATPTREGGSRPSGGGTRHPARPVNTFGSIKTTGGSGAHRAVVAEFILVVVLIAASPIFTRKGSGSHLYQAGDFVRLSATCLLFFVLALLSNSAGTARIAAAFGGLVTVGVMFSARDSVTAIASLFTPVSTASHTLSGQQMGLPNQGPGTAQVTGVANLP